ncbi:MAG: hypothetical protein V2G41_09385 [bacterium JZ-2024 1]
MKHIVAIPLMHGAFSLVLAPPSSADGTGAGGISFLYDAADWDGVVAVYFEAVLTATPETGTATAHAGLFTATGTTPVSGSQVSVTDTFARVRSGDIKASLVSGTTYYAKAWVETTNGSGVIHCARLIFVQSGQTKTVCVFEIGDSFSSTSSTWASAIDRYLYEAGAFNGTVQIFFEADLRSTTSSTTAAIQLTDEAGTVVSGSGLSTTSTSLVRLRSPALTLTDGTQYKAMYRRAAGTGTAYFSSARVIVKLSNYTKAQIPITLTREQNPSAGSAWFGPYFLYEPGLWDGQLSPKHEAMARVSASGTTGTTLVRNATVGADISGSEANFSSTSFSRVRSSTFALPGSNADLGISLNRTAGTGTVYSRYNRLLIDWIGVQTYDESGKQQTILAVQSRTDTAINGEAGKSQTILCASAGSAVAVFSESGLLSPVRCLQSATDVLPFNETGRAQVVIGQQSQSDTALWVETGREVVVKAITVENDALVCAESGKMQICRGLQSETEWLVFPESRGQTILVLQSVGQQAQAMQETGRIATARAMQAETDVALFVEGDKSAIVRALQARTEWAVFPETGRLGLVIVSTTRTPEFLGLGESGRLQTAKAFQSSSQTMIAYEGAKQSVIRALQAKTDAAIFQESGRNQVIIVGQAGFDAPAWGEAGKLALLLVAVSGSEQPIFGESGKIITIRVLQEMYDISPRRPRFYEGFVLTMDELDEVVAAQLAVQDRMAMSVVSGLAVSFQANSVTVSEGVVYENFRRRRILQTELDVTNTGTAHTEYISIVDGVVNISTSPRAPGDLPVADVEVSASGTVLGVTDVRPKYVDLKTDSGAVIVTLRPSSVSAVGKVGVGDAPSASFYVVGGDVVIDDSSRGKIFRAPDGKYWRVRVSPIGARIVDGPFTTIPT